MFEKENNFWLFEKENNLLLFPQLRAARRGAGPVLARPSQRTGVQEQQHLSGRHQPGERESWEGEPHPTLKKH